MSKALQNLILSWMEEGSETLDDDLPRHIDENEAVEVCYEDFLTSVKWFCNGIKNGAPNKTTDEKNYGKWLLLEFARRIDREE